MREEIIEETREVTKEDMRGEMREETKKKTSDETRKKQDIVTMSCCFKIQSGHKVDSEYECFHKVNVKIHGVKIITQVSSDEQDKYKVTVFKEK